MACSCMSTRCTGFVLALLSAIVIALGVADILFTWQYYCTDPQYGCSTTAEPYLWVWIGAPIWGGIVVYSTGLSAMCLGTNPTRLRWYAFKLFLSAFVFGPAITVLAVLELVRGATGPRTFYTLDGKSPGNIRTDGIAYILKHHFPLTIAIHGATITISCALHLLCLFCKPNNQQQNTTSVQQVTAQPRRYEFETQHPSEPMYTRTPVNQFAAPPVRYSGGAYCQAGDFQQGVPNPGCQAGDFQQGVSNPGFRSTFFYTNKY